MTRPASPAKWLLRRPSDTGRTRLFCFPYSGVGASMYNRWPERIGTTDICSVQLPGRENRIRETHYGSYENLAELAAEGLRPFLDRPFAFFGHCGGALAAFATALQLQRTGGPVPQWVFASSQVAPHDGPFGRFLSMDRRELRAELATLTTALGGQPNPDALDFGVDVLLADVAANQVYRLDEPVDTAFGVHAVGWRDDAEIPPEMMAGWAAYPSADRFRYTVLAGEHHAFLGHPPELLELFRSGLAEGPDAARAGDREMGGERTW